MRLHYLISCILPLLQVALAAEATEGASPSPPGVKFLYNANITVGLTVDVGAIPAGNVSVIPVIGGALIGPNLSGASLRHYFLRSVNGIDFYQVPLGLLRNRD